jgi:hypothetical protein
VPPLLLKDDEFELIFGITELEEDVLGIKELADDVFGRIELADDVFGSMELDEEEEPGNQELEGARS